MPHFAPWCEVLLTSWSWGILYVLLTKAPYGKQEPQSYGAEVGDVNCLDGGCEEGVEGGHPSCPAWEARTPLWPPRL